MKQASDFVENRHTIDLDGHFKLQEKNLLELLFHMKANKKFFWPEKKPNSQDIEIHQISIILI